MKVQEFGDSEFGFVKGSDNEALERWDLVGWELKGLDEGFRLKV